MNPTTATTIKHYHRMSNGSYWAYAHVGELCPEPDSINTTPVQVLALNARSN